MTIKKILPQNNSPEKGFFFLLGFILLGYAFGTLISYCILTFYSHYQPETSLSGLLNNTTILKWYNAVNSVFTFAFPALITNRLCNIKFTENKEKRPHNATILLFGSFIGIVALFPFINYLSDLNMSLSLPSWASGLETLMRNLENEMQELSQKFLLAENFSDLFFNLIIMALIPAITEEILFRGSLQQLIYRHTKKSLYSIWFTAFIFSIVHLQFYTFLPRFILGGYLGFLFYRTGSLFIPIFAHFTNNMLCVCLEYGVQHHYIDSDLTEHIGTGDTMWMSIVGFIIFGIILYQLFFSSKQSNLLH